MGTGLSAKKYNKQGVYLAVITLAVILSYNIFQKFDSRIITKPGLNGRSIEDIIEEYGPPDHINDFFLSRRLMYEFRGGLRSIFGMEKIKSGKVRVKEYWWKDKNYNFVVWFYEKKGKWTSIDNLRWNYHRINF